MALFALWRDDAVRAPADRLHHQLAAEAHLVPEIATVQAIETLAGRWQLAAFACATRYYSADAQVWAAPDGGVCVLQGVAWRDLGDQARLIDAAGFAALLDRIDARLGPDIRGEYAVARLLPDGRLLACTDRSGVQQLFHRPDRAQMLANRAAFLALLAGDWTPDEEAGLWLATIGYRVGQASGWRGVRQLGQAEMIAGGRIVPLPDRVLQLDRARGLAEELLTQGIAQAESAIRLAAGESPVELPVTGGKDSRAVLALALAAGLGDRLTLTTRGPAGHPDVVAAERLADAIGRPHRRDPPRADQAGGEAIESLVAALQAHGYQTDGGMGGWDLLVGERPGTTTSLTGHLGEVLKGVGKGAGPAALVTPPGLFDALGLLRAPARAQLEERLAEQARDMAAAGALPGDLPDLFYWRNRVPNWLGGIRAVRSHEAQPITPLGAPALIDLAFGLSPAERARELIHFRIVERCAPALLTLPFAHQRWSPTLLGAPNVAPLLAPADMPLFGNWQWRLNRSAALRAWLRDFFRAQDIPLWDGLDRAALVDQLTNKHFDYHAAILLLGIVAAAFHQSAGVRTSKIGEDQAGNSSGRPIRPKLPCPAAPVAIEGHIDAVSGVARRDGRTIVLTRRDGRIEIGGWAWAPAMPGAALMIEACADGRGIASAEASGRRPDLLAAGIGSGLYGFSLRFEISHLVGAAALRIGHGAGTIASFALVDEIARA